MRTAKKICRISCQKTVGTYKPCLLLQNLVIGNLRYMPTCCGEAIAELVLNEPPLYGLMIRRAEKREGAA